MSALQDINILFNQNSLLVILSLVVVILFSFLAYRKTVPKISIWQKYLLITLRGLALSLVLLLIFEPELQLKSAKLVKPKNYVFVDNSKSINYSDTLQVKNLIKKLITLKDKGTTNINLFSFSSDISELNSSPIRFDGSATNFENVFNFVKSQNENISSVTIVSDGIINDGKFQKQYYEEFDFPVNTINIGNEEKQPDVKISRIKKSDFIYLNKKTEIKIILESTKINEEVILKLSDKNKNYTSKRIFIDKNFKSVSLDFTGKELGKKTLTLSISKISNEKNIDNNTESFDIEVVKEKKKVALISSSLSFDYRFIKSIIKRNESLELAEFVQFNNESFLNKKNIKNSEVLFFIGFPADQTSDEEIQIVKKIISTEKKPLFLFLSPGTNFRKLNKFKEFTGIVFNEINSTLSKEFTVKQVDLNTPLLQVNGSAFPKLYSELPPLTKNFEIGFEVQPSVLATAIYNGVEIKEPVIVTNKINSIKSVIVLASDIWRWKLNNKNEDDLLENFILAGNKWLTTKTTLKNISIKTNKSEYLNGESIEFFGKVYSEILEPVIDSEIIVNVKGENYSREVKLRNNMDGSYFSKLLIAENGQYSYQAKVLRKSKVISELSGNFTILNKDLESTRLVANHKLLSEISALTNGNNFSIAQNDSLLSLIIRTSQLNEYNEPVISTYKINRNNFILALIVILFSLEWTLRKRFQML